MQDIPSIDIAESNTRTRLSVGAACRDPGFMLVRGHGIAIDKIARVRSAVVDYFDRPYEVKLCDRITRDNYRGYIPQGFFSANTGAQPADHYEGYKLHTETHAGDPICAECDLYGPNKWPEQAGELKEAVLDYWRACDQVTERLLAMLADILKIDAEWLSQQFVKPLTNMTLLHYPPQPPDSSGFGIHPHKDTDALTILAPDPVGGLMVRARNTPHWISVSAPADALVVNIGDLLELWSGGYFVSTPHKVVNQTGAERYSFPYFAVPRYDTVVAPLAAPQPGFERDDVHVGDVSREVWRTNWPDTTPANPKFDLGTLQDTLSS